MQLVIALLFFPIISWGYISPGQGGQVVHCQTNSFEQNSSMATLYGQRLWHYTPATLGHNLDEAMATLQIRFAKLDPARLKLDFQRFSFNAQFLPEVELVNRADWDETVVKGCVVKKAILSRYTQLPSEKFFIVNQDLWNTLSTSTQATLILEHLLMFFDVGSPPPKIENVRRIVSFLVSEEFNSTSAIEFLKVQSLADYSLLDFHGAWVGSVDFNHPAPAELKTYRDFHSCVYLPYQAGCLDLDPGAPIRIDQNWKIRGFHLRYSEQTYTLKDGTKIFIGNANFENQEAKFHKSGEIASAYLVRDQELKTPGGDKVVCLAKHRIEFDQNGRALSCYANAGTAYNMD